ncbi:phosphoenolpyruvate carboxykinase (ATP) [Pseudogemmatithrix spongiicola]|uniref:Phosphoenolpyruvate carboxykinase (ATP) n=1 Tax=Pseudogemmatithrix spongiicola TaxID=3062599 RepID=A0AA49JVC3_9BACT|nr:phosphoenolpyruvate carboxykinase (ATP) [Gemmatimonadaceae bacterium 'strain 138']WKW15619.1 phosphoenolpyruvate carboxykinase (ATP) [Gemmatimonadaceae bacterium 'strain 318']
MTTASAPVRESSTGLGAQGLKPAGTLHWNLEAPDLVQAAIRKGEGELAHMGPFVAVTKPHTGRSPNDKFVVKEPSTENDVDWGKVNQPISEAHFETLLADVQAYLNQQGELFVQDLYCGADAAYRLSCRYVTPNAWHANFVRNMFIRPDVSALASFVPNFSILHAPEFQADPAKHGTRTSTFIVLNLAKRTILIGGTRYAGELKKSMFTVMNYMLPKQGVLSMHCSANIGNDGDTALFFGLSGTGKTTLSADPERGLIGDDEHGWSEHGVFNFEGGCYAKVINLSKEQEPDIYATTEMFGTILENVVLEPGTKRVDFGSQAITENTRASYPLHYIRNHVPSGRGNHPKHVVFLTADAFGVLPPVAKLTPEQAMYYFLSGYTAKLAGTERGVTEPQATFSACFGAVFLVWHPTKYAEMLGELLKKHGSQVWLVNTGWSGGPYGVGARMKLPYTRAMVRAALSGALEKEDTITDPIFGLHLPVHVEGVPNEVLNPRNTWKDSKAYDEQAKKLAAMFQENIKKFGAAVSADILSAGPKG